MPKILRETKVTDFFQKRPSLLISSDSSPTLSQSPSLGLPRSAPRGNPSQPVAKRKPGRPKGSGKKAKQGHGQPVLVIDLSSLPGDSNGPCVPPLLASGSSPFGSGTSSKRQSGKPKRGRNKPENYNKVSCSLRSSTKVDLRGSRTISPLDPASQPRSSILYSSPKENSSPQSSVPSKRKLDDDNDTASITSSGVPLSLYYVPQQTSSPGSSKPPEPPLTTEGLSSSLTNKRCSLGSRVPHSLRAPATPKRLRGNDIIPTSQSNEAGLYSPIRPNIISRHRNDVQESVENWRHGRSAYKRNIVSPSRSTPRGDYSLEVDRPPSPLTSYPNTTSLGSPLSSFAAADIIPSDVDFDSLPAPLTQHALPTPSSSSEGKAHPSLPQIAKPSPVRPVTPPPSSPEQEQPMPVPVAPKDSKVRTAEIIAEIWENVRAKSVSDSDDSYLHAPIKDELSSEEEDDEPFWKRTKTLACHVTPAGRARRNYSLSSLPSPPSPSLSPPPLRDDLLPQFNDHNDDNQRVPGFSNSDPISPLKGKRRVRTSHRNRAFNPSTVAAKRDARKPDPIKAMLRERKREARVGGGIDALNRAEDYDHDTLLSDFSIEEEEPIDAARLSSVDENTTRVPPTGLQTNDTGADIVAIALEDEVQQGDRERLLGAKEGEAVGKILDADRKMGQTAIHSVFGVSVFVNDHEGTVDTELYTMARPACELARGKTATLDMLNEAIGQQDIEYMQAVFGILAADDMATPGVAQWLCEQALWYGHEHVGRFSRKFLLEMPLWAQSYPGSPLSVALLVQTMIRLGLRKDLSIHLQPLRDATFSRLQNRPVVLRSIVKLIASFAPRWSMEQLPDVVMALLLIGADMHTTTELRRDILCSISLLCRQLPAEPEDSTEVSIANKVLNLTKIISASDQALLLSYFTKGSPSCLRIARAVAHHVLIGSTISPVNYTLPPLGPLVAVLSSPDEQFSITDSTDYDALTSRVAVLAVALSGIDSYVAEESTLRKLAHVPEGSPRKKEPVPLELIRARLDAIHGKIFDTRAAHLDRSRAKGAIQRLSMRIHYQRTALSKTGGQLRLGDFFSPGGNSRQPKRRNWS